MITKTAYLKFVQCGKAFWLDRVDPTSATPPDATTQRRFQAGNEVDKWSQKAFPNGYLIPYRIHPVDMAGLTTDAMKAGHETLFQATFSVNGLLVKADILTQTQTGWHLLEVKSSTKYKPDEHLLDAAFQVHVLKQVGVMVTKVSLMHLNSKSIFPDLQDLLVQTDITTEVMAALPRVAEDVEHMKQLLGKQDVPDISIGRHCTRPRTCVFYEHCWQDVQGLTIYDIPRLSAKKTEQLEALDARYLQDVPADFPLTATQRGFVARFVQELIDIDSLVIQQMLNELVYPLYFLDFETIDYAVPRFEQCKPYQQVPFQYSCHILAEDGTLTHVEYLHTEADDPRRPLAQALINHIGSKGHLVAYNSSFEASVLRHLAEVVPEHAPALLAMAERLWDQLPIFRKHYKDYRFGKSNSLKAVLPVVANLTYKELAVQNGSQAQVIWQNMLLLDDPIEKAQRAQELKAYCHLDTLAMVEIHDVLGTV